MTKRFLRFIIILIVIGLVVGLAACSRSASKSPTPTSSGKPPVPGGKATDQTMGLFDENATATALAANVATATKQPATGEGVVQETPVAVTATPELVGPAAPATAVPATPTVAISTPVKPTSYTLQKGEFPYCIARRFNLNPSELLSLNGLSPDSQVFPGKVLKIPQTSGTFPGNRALRSHPTDYTVKSGDTIYSVACLYGDVSPEMIAQANGLSSPYTLTAGNKLRIP